MEKEIKIRSFLGKFGIRRYNGNICTDICKGRNGMELDVAKFAIEGETGYQNAASRKRRKPDIY